MQQRVTNEIGLKSINAVLAVQGQSPGS